ncbi:hypothetical protein BTO32_14905 [Marinobacter lutaoensis]|uniref:Helicase n=2 Tax=Marinobacter lutaoensis TaxID=135739 RepID=A0A1V2DPR9_9GAMM|nr:hypothetical protein BTO32_14905 [Marinobacter lutaoensis]
METRTWLTFQYPATDANARATLALAKRITQTGTERIQITDRRSRQYFDSQRARLLQQHTETRIRRQEDGSALRAALAASAGMAGQPEKRVLIADTPQGKSDSPDITVVTGRTPATRLQATALKIYALRDPNDPERLRNGYSNAGLYELILSHPGARYVKGTKTRSGYFRVPVSETTANLLKVLMNRYGLRPEARVPVLGNKPFVAAIKERLHHLRNCYQLSFLDSLETTIGRPNLPRPKGLNYLPYQEAGIRYALTLGNALIADEPGLGKTIQAIGVSNALPDTRRILVITPASLKINWQREWRKWSVKELSVHRVPDGRPESWSPDADVVVLNFDLVEQHYERLTEKPWDLLIVDEAHALKNPDAKRTKLILGHGQGRNHVPGIPAQRRLYLTGTPTLNRPRELWPLVHSLDPDFFSDRRAFEVRYCNGHQTKYGWDARGASNLSELHRQLRARVMVRRKKDQVLKDLPPKTRQLIELDHPAVSAYTGSFRKLSEAQKTLRALYDERQELDARAHRGEIAHESYQQQAHRLSEAARIAFHQMSQARKETALAKVPQVVELIKTTLSNGKLILFCHHHEVVEAYVDALNQHFKREAGRQGTPNTVAVVTGQTANDERQVQADRFQEDDRCRVFIGTIGSAGTGLTLTEASTVLFAELDWVPGNMSQAEDRAHRIGQKDHVLVYHTAIEHSLEARMIRRLIEKQEVIDQTLDGPSVPSDRLNRPATEDAEDRFMDWVFSIAQSASDAAGIVGADELGGTLDESPGLAGRSRPALSAVPN